MSLFYHLRFVWDDRSPIENWAIPAALFSSSSSLLVDGCRFLSRMSWYFVFPIHPPFNYMNFASTFMKKKKTAPHYYFLTSTLHCRYGVFGVMCSAFCPLNMLCVIQRVIWCDLTDYVVPVFSRLVQLLRIKRIVGVGFFYVCNPATTN